MKLIKNTSDGRVAHIDTILSEWGMLNLYRQEAKGILSTYENEAAFWSSQAPINSVDMTPTGSYDELTDRALVDLGAGWEIVER